MNDENVMTPDEREVELLLARLRPAKNSIDRDALMFDAGRRSVRRTGWVWPSVAAVLAVALTVSVATRPGARPVEVCSSALPNVATAVEASSPSGPPIDQSKFGYIQMRNILSTKGIDSLPMPELPTASGNPLSTMNGEETFSIQKGV